MLNTCILFRESEETKQEFYELQNISLKYFNNFDLVRFRSGIPLYSIVFGRYSVLPFYKELDDELYIIKNSHLINSYDQHKYIANMKWYHDIFNITPKTIFNCGWSNVPEFHDGWVIKGLTNSRKFQWDTHMYAKDRKSLKNIIKILLDDPFIKDQGLAIREYIPLETYEIGINNMRFTNEWRFFFLNNKIIDYGFYWSTINDKNIIPKDIDIEGKKLAQIAANIISKKVPFFVVDVAKTRSGEWIVIEINDAQMSGLSTIPAKRFYNNLIQMII